MSPDPLPRIAHPDVALDVLDQIIEEQEATFATARAALERAKEAVHGLRRVKAADELGRLAETLDPAILADAVSSLMGEAGAGGIIRSYINLVDAGPGLEGGPTAALERFFQGGGVQRALYPVSALEDPQGQRLMAQWAALGEQQRVLSQTDTEFAVFGDAGVVAFAEWGNPASGYVLMREPIVVATFMGFFDAQWSQAATVPTEQSQSTDRLVELLGLGLKDEAIARQLGIGLRTVRRHIAVLMGQEAVHTRFQLGYALGRAEARVRDATGEPGSRDERPGARGIRPR